MPHTLVIGYGNPDRRDDGAALHVVDRVRHRAGRPPVEEHDGALGELGQDTAVFVPMLLPELALDAAAYERVVLVDAHADDPRPVVAVRVEPEYRVPPVSHHLSAAMFAWLVQQAGLHETEVLLVSLRGHCFDPGRSLSKRTAAMVPLAAAHVAHLCRAARNPEAWNPRSGARGCTADTLGPHRAAAELKGWNSMKHQRGPWGKEEGSLTKGGSPWSCPAPVPPMSRGRTPRSGRMPRK